MNATMTDDQIDALREIVSIGAGNAATALSQMVQMKIDISVPNVDFLPLDQAAGIFGGPEALVTAIYLELLGDGSGVILFTFKKEDALLLADCLIGSARGSTKVLSDMTRSALKETATILCGAYLSSLSQLIDMSFLMSAPGIAQDMGGAIIDAVMAETCKKADYAIIVNTQMTIVDVEVMAHFFFIPESDSLEEIMKKIGV